MKLPSELRDRASTGASWNSWRVEDRSLPERKEPSFRRTENAVLCSRRPETLSFNFALDRPLPYIPKIVAGCRVRALGVPRETPRSSRSLLSLISSEAKIRQFIFHRLIRYLRAAVISVTTLKSFVSASGKRSKRYSRKVSYTDKKKVRLRHLNVRAATWKNISFLQLWACLIQQFFVWIKQHIFVSLNYFVRPTEYVFDRIFGWLKRIFYQVIKNLTYIENRSWINERFRQGSSNISRTKQNISMTQKYLCEANRSRPSLEVFTWTFRQADSASVALFVPASPSFYSTEESHRGAVASRA